MSNNTFTLQNIDRVNFYGVDGGADVYLEGVSTGTSGVCVSGSLLVNGDYMNFGTSLGTSGHGFRSSDSGSSIQFKHSGGEWITISGASVAGSNNEIQFNDNGNFGACAGFTFDNSTNNFVVGANDNTIITSSSNAVVIGGVSNHAYADMAFVAGGFNNSASGTSSAVIGGNSNSVKGINAINAGIFVGSGNTINSGGYFSANIAGQNNTVSGPYSANIAGSSNTIATGAHSANIAGSGNTVNSFFTANIGGQNNEVNGNDSVNAGGVSNYINGTQTFVAGGVSNQAYADTAFVAGGFNNSASGTSSAVVGGFDNSATGSASGNVAGKNNTVSGIESGNLAGEDNIVSGTESGNLAGEQNTVTSNNSGNVSGENNTVSGNHSGNLAGRSNSVSGVNSANIAGRDNTISTSTEYSVIAGGVSNQAYADMAFVAGGFNNSASGTSSAVVGGNSNSVFSNNTVALGGEGLSTQTGTSWEKMALAGTYNNYLTYPWDESETQTLQGTCYRFLVGSGGGALTRNNAFAVDDVGNLYFGTQAGACIYTRTESNTYEPINLGGGGGGGGTTTPNGPENSVQFNISSDFTGTSSLQFFEASSNTTGGVCALTVDGNVFSRGLSVVESSDLSGSVYDIPVENFVNGVVFPQYGTAGNEEHHVVQVPTLANITASYSDVLRDGQFFETLIYGTSTGVSIGLSIPADITVLSNTGVSFDTRLIKNRTPVYTGTGMSFHGATLWNGETYQGVVIKSRYTSTGVSMYPSSTAFYN
mgnify:FL=1|tara:strand:- start:226 stop:2511 length:2286 start_codon:yes stop_codon:yes gene_type:complete